jgi:MOSC domain-containing protein YiiM
VQHPTAAALDAGLDEIRRSPGDDGRLELIVRRPATDEREVLAEGELDYDVGLVGDTWHARRTSSTTDGSPHPEKQLTLMNSRTARLVAGGLERAALAGDQLYVDLDISEANLPAGTRLTIGSAVVEITAQPHRGCKKFTDRFGADSLRFVNSAVGNELRLRGANAKVVTAGTIRTGDAVRKA